MNAIPHPKRKKKSAWVFGREKERAAEKQRVDLLPSRSGSGDGKEKYTRCCIRNERKEARVNQAAAFWRMDLLLNPRSTETSFCKRKIHYKITKSF